MDDRINSFEEDDICDLDPAKICDSCEKCLGLTEMDYRIVRIDGVVESADGVEEYILEDEKLSGEEGYESPNEELFDMDYIEDIPELREEYNNKINKLLGRE